jgi:bifunctional UDP-N-acetylglucosamine pyrophosphorylase/glucosamine-1-phosphate N-acetyltransferase
MKKTKSNKSKNSQTKAPCAVIILAAGKGTRMKSRRPKVLHEIGGLSMIGHVIKTAEALQPEKIIVVVGPDMEEVAQAVKPHATVIQKQQAGTGDAVKAAMPLLKNFKGDVLVLYGDVPLITTDDLVSLRAQRAQSKAGLCIAAMESENPVSYGRIVLNKDGSLKEIVEAKDATPAQKEITLCNAGLLCVDGAQLPRWLEKITNKNKQKEYYLTDLPAIAARDKIKTSVFEIDEESVTGVNDRAGLALAESVFQNRKRLQVLMNGATMIDAMNVWFSWDTIIGSDVVIEPSVFFGPGVTVDSGVTIRAFSHLEGVKIAKDVTIGPFARIRPGTTLGEGAKIGNFVEIKKSNIGKGSKINHLAYVGDTIMGEGTNFSAGAITVNYDGFDKHQTTIGKNVMIGSNVNLVAPVEIQDGAFVAAGSTITEDVPSDALGIARKRQDIRPGWAATFRRQKKAVKARKS